MHQVRSYRNDRAGEASSRIEGTEASMSDVFDAQATAEAVAGGIRRLWHES